MTEKQLPLIIKVKEFLIDNLGFHSGSVFKLKNSSAIKLTSQKAINNSKGSILLIIKNIHIIQNYLIPFFNKVKFLSKKGQ